MNKTKVNYWLDLLITVAFLLSAVSGVVFLLPVGSATVFGVAYRTWDQLHTWSSLLMIAGVGVHLALHWKWITTMTRKTFLHARQPARAAYATDGVVAGRRQFLRGAGVGVMAAGALVFGLRSIFRAHLEDAALVKTDAATATDMQQPGAVVAEPALVSTEAEAATEAVAPVVSGELPLLPTVTPTAVHTVASTATPVSLWTSGAARNGQSSQRVTVACPKGLVNDPYPGRCRHYVDRDGDGICDLSVPIYG